MSEEIGKCYVCGEGLTWVEGQGSCSLEENVDYEHRNIKGMTCWNCGTRYNNFVSEDNTPNNEDYVECEDQGFGKCTVCGGILKWDADNMRSDIYEEVADTDRDSIIRTLTCTKCGCTVEAIEPSELEKKYCQFPHWLYKDARRI